GTTQDASKAIDSAAQSSAISLAEPLTEKIVVAADRKNKATLNNTEKFEDHPSVSGDSGTSQMDRLLLKSKLSTDQEWTPLTKASRKIESTKATPSAHSTLKRCATPAKTPSKEKAETEFRRLRQSFCFKARPLPSFYNERETPKSPLKKVEPDFDLDIKDDTEEECSNFGKVKAYPCFETLNSDM
nr:hypothetical protein [Tanacetum cinerariifolium]